MSSADHVGFGGKLCPINENAIPMGQNRFLAQVVGENGNINASGEVASIYTLRVLLSYIRAPVDLDSGRHGRRALGVTEVGQ